jgi:hypothetical protein
MGKQSNFELNYEFIGREFLTWLWWASEVNGGKIPCTIDKSGDLLRVELTNSLMIESAGNVNEATTVKADGPGQTEEARTALRVGKKVAKCRLSLDYGAWHFECNLDSYLTISGARLPYLLAVDDPRNIDERLRLLGNLELIVYKTFANFINIRTGPEWDKHEDALREWVQNAQ